MTPRQLANKAMALILQYLKASGKEGCLGYTTYAVVVVKGSNGLIVYIAEAGVSAPGIGKPLLDAVEGGLKEYAVLGCVNVDSSSGGVAVNDAERQALRTAADHKQGPLQAVVASRAFCSNCNGAIQGLGLTIHGPAEASV